MPAIPPSNDTSHIGLEVICAWPVSGQYGPGSRALYYALVAACILARKAEVIRNACLAAALVFPAVAALHGIVLAVVHIHGAVDMDVYGAFQFCAIGILAAPVTVLLSSTYFEYHGRNIIFVWSSIILAGLISLTVEFYRVDPRKCTHDNFGNPLSTEPVDFPYGNAKCGLTCSVAEGPFNPMRNGSANNIYIIPAPTALPFGEATVLAAACCIPTILLLVSMWIRILEINWRIRFGSGDDDEDIGDVKTGNTALTLLRKFFGIPIFGAAVLAVLIIGEINLFSHQVRHQTEPVANIGQWGTIVGTGLALLGSLYILVAQAMAQERNRDANPGVALDTGLIHRTARLFIKFGDYFATPAKYRFDDSEFRHGRATNEYPEIPGEEGRNRDLSEIRRSFNRQRGDSDAISIGTNLSRQDSQAESEKGGHNSGSDVESGPETPKLEAPRKRRDTLEVPAIRRISGRDSLPTTPSRPSITSSPRESSPAVGQRSPTIMVSDNSDTPYPEHVIL